MNNLKHNEISFLDIRNISNNEKENIIISYDDKGNTHSIFSDDIWDFSFKISKNNGNVQKRLLFKNKIFSDGSKIINNKFYLTLYKEAIYNIFVSGLKTTTINSHFNNFFIFLDYCYTYYNNKKLNELTTEEINYFASFLEKDKKKYKSKGKILNSVKQLVFFPNHNFSFSINFEPFENIFFKHVDKNKNTQVNQTKIIPDEKWNSIINHCHHSIKEFQSNIKIENKILEVLKDSLTNKANHRFNLFFKKKLKSNISQYKNATNYYNYIADLQIACGMIIQAFTGMRMSELQSIKTNCITSELIKYEGKEFNVLKIEGLTFKYQNKVSFNDNEGKITSWICPEIVAEAVNVLETATRIPRFKINHKIKEIKKELIDTYDLDNSKELLFISNKVPTTININNKHLVQIVNYTQKNYNNYILKHNIKLDFELHSHCFRRTLARFLSRSLIDIEVEAIKEQFKHFSKDITLYYMREDKQLESNFAELIEEYQNKKDDINKNERELVFDKMRNSIDSAILTANNLEELLLLTNGKQLKVINEYAASINGSNSIFSPIDCLSCEGNVIIPHVHLSYWSEMLVTYNEMIEVEPNSVWYKTERNMILNVIKTLEKNNIYITGDKK
jgi:integrase